MPKPYCYDAICVRTIDGDTIEMDIDLGFHTWRRDRVRVLGINCPEMRGADKVAGQRAKQFTSDWCDARSGLVRITTTINPNDHFGRVLADVFDRERQEDNLTSALLASGNGVPYKEK